jgi:hypothetical protein
MPILMRPTRESEIVLERIRKILAAGANVVLTTKGIDDLCLKEFVEAGAMAVRRCRKEDLRRIAKATGGTLVSSLANLEGEESFEPSYLGTAEEVVQERISDDELILIKGTKVVNSSSIVLRGANDYMLDEMERALHDTLSIIKRTLESGSVVPGGGAVESSLSIYLENFATTVVSRWALSYVALSRLIYNCRVPGSNWQSPNLPLRYSLSPRHWLSTRRRIRPTWWRNYVLIITPRRMPLLATLKRHSCAMASTCSTAKCATMLPLVSLSRQLARFAVSSRRLKPQSRYFVSTMRSSVFLVSLKFLVAMFVTLNCDIVTESKGEPDTHGH